MDISMFFKFPGLLITIGAVLLILSIVLLIVAFKTGNDETENEVEENKQLKEEKPVEIKEEEKEIVVKEKPKKDKKEQIEDEGLDLTKVYELTENKEEPIKEKDEVEDEVKEQETENKEVITDISDQEEKEQVDDDIELL